MSQVPVLRSPIGFLLIPQFAMIALSSAIEPLRIANRYVARKYAWRLLSLDGKAVPDDNGILIQPDSAYHRCGQLGTLILCSDIRPERFYSAALKRWLHALDRAGTTLASLDTGCFLLARAGLLKGRRVTMHWEVLPSFHERYPDIEVRPTLFEVGAERMTCAGGTAVIDMMLNEIAVEHGPQVANRVAEHCLHEHIRAGSSGQRMATPLRTGAYHPKLARALAWLEARLDAPVRVAALAGEMRLSPRHLLRLFRDHLGETPQRHHLRLRLERARALLAQTDLGMGEVGEACGFPSPAQFSRAYRSLYGETPSGTRRRQRGPRPVLDGAA
ncbi:MAG: GlxA family transcriptional regulator [Proteobacteria bacterium]|nr:GlxA family transcriptional regulator [Pseudomonadota bacterium]